jgi:prepilin-type N-terminal cleavage/methylation domain-containing protein
MRKGFTLIELIFVILIFGILSKFGADILYKIYENYVYSNTFNRLENQSEAAVKQIANRLQYRIKDATIARIDAASPGILEIGDNIAGANVLEWIGMDIDGWHGTIDTTPPIGPDWSGFIDLSASSATSLSTPGTLLPNNTSGAVFFIGSDVDLNSDFGWGGAITNQNGAMHPITFDGAGNIDSNTTADFTGVDVFEYYEFSKSAFAVALEGGGQLFLYYGFQPWAGQGITSVSKSLLMENVSSFKFTSMGDILIIQVCVDDGNVTGVGTYSICKEKVVF